MKERPILFSAPMVRAILAGTKTQTRRVAIKSSTPGLVVPCDFDAAEAKLELENTYNGVRYWKACPYGQPGDRLWVRETWQAVSGNDRARHIMTHPSPDRGWLEYAATPRDDEPAYKWRPSIHMPRWASRITLEITGVRVEPLQLISEADAKAEGAEPNDVYAGPEKDRASGWRNGYRILWEQINGAGSWVANPLVWAIEFKRVLQ